VSVRGVDPTALRRTMARFAAGVTLVTTVHEGLAHALTATAVTSVSLEPPLVLVCVSRASRFHPAVLASGTWAVSILPADAEPLARRFSHRGRDLLTQFEGVAYEPAPHSGAPVLSGALAWLDCQTWAAYDGGDHTIVVGQVVATGVEADGEESLARRPLTYYRSTYQTLT